MPEHGVWVRTLLMTPEMTWYSDRLTPCLAFCIIPFARSVIKSENKIRLHTSPCFNPRGHDHTQLCEVVTDTNPCFYGTHFLWHSSFFPSDHLCACVRACVRACECVCVCDFSIVTSSAYSLLQHSHFFNTVTSST